MKKRRSIIRKHENAVRGESRINLYDSHFEQAFGERVICVYVRQIRYRMHVSDAIFKEPRVRIVIYIQKWISIRLVDALFDR